MTLTTAPKPMSTLAAQGGLSFIETQFPVSKMSVESFRERAAKQGQTLTGLGKWWGRKPLVLCRATILGLLLPATDDPAADRDVFLRLMTMDEDGLLHRRNKSIPAKGLFARLPASDRDRFFEADSTEESAKLKRGLSREDKDALQARVFLSLAYNEKMEYVCRPEQKAGPSPESWKVINDHLGTSSTTLPGLVAELGKRRFGHVPRVGDSFCGGGSIPFEAARLGCDTYGSDLNPVAALLTWAALNIVGGGEQIAGEVKKAQREIFDAVDSTLTKLGIDHNSLGWRADAYLYCVEVRDPESGWLVPLAPSWVLGERTATIAELIPDPKNCRYDIAIRSGASPDEMGRAKKNATIRDYRMIPSAGAPGTPIESLSRGLRLWDASDIQPRKDDVFQERLFCVRWVETYYTREVDGQLVETSKRDAEAMPGFEELLSSGEIERKTRRHYRGVAPEDLEREQQVLELLRDRWMEWTARGFVPTRRIERGKDINRPTNARGWTHWHHFFNPRQLLTNGLFAEHIATRLLTSSQSPALSIGAILGLNRIADWNSRQSRWHSGVGNEKGEQAFFKPSLSTPLFNYCCRTILSLDTTFLSNVSECRKLARHDIQLTDARRITRNSDLWITDPPYADAVNYHELSEYFLAWCEKRLPELFPGWYADSKRVLAIKGDNPEVFSKAMVDCYRRLSELMPANGQQVVMFTHHDASVWADLTNIIWAAGLQVTAAWCIATETDSTLKQGNFVQGTVLLVLRKQQSKEVAFLDEVYNEVECEVRRQMDSMRDLDDASDPNFSDTDYQLAAYAAALRVLTSKKIEEIDAAYELTRTRDRSEKSQVEKVIEKAVAIACDHLVPRGIETHLWKSLAAIERFYLKGLEMESHGERREGVYQELARGFGIDEYRSLLASTKANETRLKSASDFKAREMGGEVGGFGASLVRMALFAAYKCGETDGTRDPLNWLKTEVKNYADNRGRIIEILEFFAALTANASMIHWHTDARAAGLVAGALRNREDNV
jgi:putative DNA methylase